MHRLLYCVLALSTLWMSAAHAQPALACGPHTKMIERLEEKYDEDLRVIGLMNNGALMQIWASARTGSWTLLSTKPNGMSCIVAAGEHFEIIEQRAGRKS